MSRSEEDSFFRNIFKQRAESVVKAEEKEEIDVRIVLNEEERRLKRLNREERKVIKSFGVSQENLKQAGLRLLPHTLFINFGKKTMKFLLATPIDGELDEIFVLSKANGKNPGLNESEFVNVECENEVIKTEGRTETIYPNEFNRHLFVDTSDALAGYKIIDIPPSCTSRHYYNVSIAMNNSVVEGRIELKDQWEVPEPLHGEKKSIIGRAGTVIDKYGEDKGSVPLILLE